MILSLALFAAGPSLSLYSGPKPEQTETYRDWITGCDNERNCAAVALEAAGTKHGATSEHLEILIEQPLAHNLDPSISIKVPGGATGSDSLSLQIDDLPAAMPPLAGERFVIKGPAARALLRNMRAGAWAALRGADGKELARSSLSGLTAALLRIDQQQGKTGTERALAKPGTRTPYDDLPGYSVSLTRPGRSERPPTAPDARVMADINAKDQCAAGSDKPAPVPRMVRLDAESTLMIVPWRCGSGTYNLYANIMIVNGFGEVRAATFDFDNGVTGDGPGNLLVNAGWQDGERVLESHLLHRAVGDCGRVDRFIWDGKQFRLSEQRVMPECRGSQARIAVWKADVTER